MPASRQHDRIGRARQYVGYTDLIVPVHVDARAFRPEIVDEVEGETVVIVDQRDVEFRHWVRDVGLAPLSPLIER
jgi:hypothetical protein